MLDRFKNRIHFYEGKSRLADDFRLGLSADVLFVGSRGGPPVGIGDAGWESGRDFIRRALSARRTELKPNVSKVKQDPSQQTLSLTNRFKTLQTSPHCYSETAPEDIL